MKYVVGVDYGTDSCRVIIVEVASGREVATAVRYYRRWGEGRYCDPARNQYRQHPLDYIESLEDALREALRLAPPGTAERVAGIGFDTTGCTPALTDREGTPLALLPRHAENPDAMFVLWKDHTALAEAARINELAHTWPTDYTAYEGGVYSSEWVWAKMAHVLTVNESLRADAYSWVEHCDWMPALLTGKTRPETMVRSRCAAGHKAMWHSSWGGLPPEEFLTAISPHLRGFRDHLYENTYTTDTQVGRLTEAWARRLGLSPQTVVATGAFDCHCGAVGAEIRPGAFVRVMGTSTCDIMVATPAEMAGRLIPGICGQVDGSVIPDMVGLEAGQSGFGDIYAWFSRVLSWPLRLLDNQEMARQIMERIIPELSREAEQIPVGASALLATDWMNGRRTPDANQRLRGTISGLTLGSDAPLIFRALVEATAFGSKAIVNRFLENGIAIREVIGIGGIAQKSPLVLRVLADVLGMPIKVARVEQACAFGAAMFAAVAAGLYNDTRAAQRAMGQGFACEYQPDLANHRIYARLYEKYCQLGKFTERCEL